MLRQLSPYLALAVALTLSGERRTPNSLSPVSHPNKQGAPQTGDDRRAKALLETGRELREKAKGKDDYQAAQQKLEEALHLYQSLGDRGGEAEASLQLALTLRARDFNRESLSFSERALELARSLGNRPLEARALGAVGVAYYWVSQYEKAIQYYEQALALWRTLGDKAGEGNILGNLGLLYRQLGQDEKGVAYLEQALPLAREAGDRRGESQVLNNLNVYYAVNKKFERAFDGFARVRQLAREAGDHNTEALGLMNMGQVRSDQGRFEEAIPLFEEALAVQRANGFQRRQISVLTVLGVAHERMGKPDQALNYYRQAQAIADTIGHYGSVFSIRGYIAHIQRKQGQLMEARAGLEKTLQEIEEVYRALRTDEFRAHNLQSSQAVFLEAIDLLGDLGDAAAALHMAERARARALLDLLAESRAEIRSGADPALLAEQQAIQSRASALRGDMLKDGLAPARRGELDAALKAEEDKLEAVARRVQGANPHFASIRYPRRGAAGIHPRRSPLLPLAGDPRRAQVSRPARPRRDRASA
jgi:tetratricopeptide (TPR) repeat protein